MAQAEEAYDGPRKLRLDQMQKTRSRSSRQSEVPDVLPPANNFKEDEVGATRVIKRRALYKVALRGIAVVVDIPPREGCDAVDTDIAFRDVPRATTH